MRDNAIVINPLAFFWREGTPLDVPLPDHKVTSASIRYRKSLLFRYGSGES